MNGKDVINFTKKKKMDSIKNRKQKDHPPKFGEKLLLKNNVGV